MTNNLHQNYRNRVILWLCLGKLREH